MLPFLLLVSLAGSMAFDVDSDNCPSRATFNAIINSASDATDAMESATVDKVISTIILVALAAFGLLLLLLGAKLVRTVIALIASMTSFVAFLYLFDWALTVHASSDTAFFVACWLPLILAIVCSMITTAIVMYLIEKLQLEAVAFFVLGAGAGGFGMLVLRNFIVAASPGLATDPAFFWYWIGMGIVALICGIAAVCMRKAIFIIATCIIGSYLFSSALMGLMQMYVAGGVSGWVFLALFFPLALLGAAVQVFVFGLGPKKESNNSKFDSPA